MAQEASTPLISVIRAGRYREPIDVEAIEALIDNGADVEETPNDGNPLSLLNKRTPLMCACDCFHKDRDRELHLRVVTSLLDAGADPNRAATGALGYNGLTTPLYVASGKYQPELVQVLLSRGASVDGMPPASRLCASCRRSPLQAACSHVRAIYSHHRPDNPYIRPEEKYSLWTRRDMQASLEVVRILLAAGADIDLGRTKAQELGISGWELYNYGISAFEFSRDDCDCPELKAIIRAHLARNLRATARGSQVWAPRVASFLI